MNTINAMIIRELKMYETLAIKAQRARLDGMDGYANALASSATTWLQMAQLSQIAKREMKKENARDVSAEVVK